MNVSDCKTHKNNINNEYIVYDKRTTLPVCLGDLNICEYVTELPRWQLIYISMLIEHGYDMHPRWEVYDVDKLLEGYEDE